MPRFHFNVFDGVTDIDHEGQEFPNWEAARLAAVIAAGEIIRDQSKRLAIGEDWRMEVADDRGLVLFRLDFSILESAAIGEVSAHGETDGTKPVGELNGPA